ncbi:hypothetical protein [Sphingomicrobium sediminis]|uniref:Outer membrane protein beta-barrel domain-containing protein n=1 Tax=Sphingomicrobium sediminis TaxID=2950949 RepID=A0A9X2EIA6_9SPHN|nr:hypothetical protein [Sphingomicrobium sediminis]MCM8557266.1 hypothetical protein [Sphingomicrobium sediminis]
MKNLFLAASAAAALIATPAFAQVGPETEIYAGGSVGYHDIESLDLSDFGATGTLDVDGLVYGGFAGVKIGGEGNVFYGVEGNYMAGSDAIDAEYGVAALVGTKVGVADLYVRSGYQLVDFDTEFLANEGADAFAMTGDDRNAFIVGFLDGFGDDDKAEGWLVGVGADVGLGNFMLRGNVDTIEFDSLRVSAGVGIRF